MSKWKQRISPVLRLVGLVVLILGARVPGNAQPSTAFYFPSASDDWERVDPATAGWRAEGLAAALEVAGQRQTTGLIILCRGRILAERYWSELPAGQAYQNAYQGRDNQGGVIEDVASAQKSIVAVLVGIAQQRGLLTLDDPVSRHLDAGWSHAAPGQEQAITIRHLLSMSSGLDTGLGYATEAGSTWLYNTPAYHLLMRILERASGQDRNTLTAAWLTGPLGMTHSAWTTRPWADPAIGFGFATTTRELARFGLLIQAGGHWGDQAIIDDPDYLAQMLSPSQPLNPAYGLLWWLNGQAFALGTDADASRKDGPLIPAAPADLVAMQGALDRKLYLVPSLGLVIARLGSAGGADGVGFNDAFWSALMMARQP